jgi:hypothetical protein
MAGGAIPFSRRRRGLVGELRSGDGNEFGMMMLDLREELVEIGAAASARIGNWPGRDSTTRESGVRWSRWN